tara:strand:+ start:346 stop:1440 length:1095 start_codon:yes stop_codon:yes gene_type:complete
MEELLQRLFKATGGLAQGVLSGFTGITNRVQKLFSNEGALSMDNIIEAGTLFALAEALSSDKQKESVSALRKEYQKLLPAFTQAKIAAGKTEAIALEDLDQLVKYGIVNERNADGQLIKQTAGPLGGSESLKYEQYYGVKPQYKVDEKTGNIMLDEGGNPITVRTGQPGLAEIEGEFQRRQQYLGDLAKSGTRVDQLKQSGQPLAEGLRGMEKTFSPELHPTQKQAGESFRGLLAAQDPTRLSGAEEAQVARGLGRMGIGLGRTSEMDKYRAAMTFGDALAAKQQRLGQALGQTGSVGSFLRPSLNPGAVFGEGTTVSPTMPGQVASFGNTAAQVLPSVSNIITSKQGEQGGKEALRNAIGLTP